MNAWKPVLTGAAQSAAIDAALHVGRRIADRERVQEAVTASATASRFPQLMEWVPYNIAQGDAGLALMFSYFDRCFPQAGWDIVGHELLTSAALSAEGVQLPPSLFGGLSGLGFATMMLSRNGTRYQRLAAAIEAELILETHELAQSIRGRHGLSVREFDVISGLAGVGAYLLAHRASPAMGAAIKHAIEALVDVSSERDEDIPRWMTPHDAIFEPTTAARYPAGNLNCGLAHGIPGPLTLMALALSAGAPVAGLREAVAHVAQWLIAHRRDDRWGVNWPAMVTLPESGRGSDEPSRAAWCYGSPGVARALWLAGTALEDDTPRDLAIEAMRCVYRRPLQARQVDSPTFCHGVAGLLQITLRFANDTGLPVFVDAAADLADQLLKAYEPRESLLCFRSIEPGGHRVDNPGLLDGAPGIALVLLAAATDVEPTWDRLFMLA